MKNHYLKVFFSKKKEIDWLNSMGKQGYLLTKVSDSKYYFTHSDKHKYSYFIEHLNSAVDSEDSAEYISAKQSAGATLVTNIGLWAYFVYNEPTYKPNTTAYKNNSIPYLWRTIYLMFFIIMGAIFAGYQAFAADFLTRVGYESDGYIGLIQINSDASTFGKGFKTIVNSLVGFINEHYLSFFVEKFGASDACIVLGALIPVILILLVFFTLNLDEYIEWKMLSKGKKSRFNKAKKV